MGQLVINFTHKPEFDRDDFIIDQSNKSAYDTIQNDYLWPDNRMLLLGENGSGKTHLANIWASLYDADIIDLRNAKPEIRDQNIVLDNIDCIEDERELFHAINMAQQKGIKMLMTSSYLPHYKLADLNSRINSLYKITITSPSLELLKIILLKSFFDRQLKVANEVLDYILNRMKRSFKYLKCLVEKLDSISAEEKRNITIPLVRKIIVENCLEEGRD